MVKKGSQGIVSFKNAKLFVEREDVQKVVKELRKKWNIPNGGFKNSKDYLAWLDNLTQSLIPLDTSKIKTMTEYEFDFVGKRFYLSRVSEIKTAGIIDKISKYSLFLQDISDACSNELKLLQHWRFFLNSYITQGKDKDSVQFRSGKTHNTPIIRVIRIKNANGGEGERRIRLEFGANTTQQDITGIWNRVKNIQKTMPEYEKTRRRTNLERDLQALKLKKGGKTHTEIYRDAPYEHPFPSEQAVAKALQRKRKIIGGQ